MLVMLMRGSVGLASHTWVGWVKLNVEAAIEIIGATLRRWVLFFRNCHGLVLAAAASQSVFCGNGA